MTLLNTEDEIKIRSIRVEHELVMRVGSEIRLKEVTIDTNLQHKEVDGDKKSMLKYNGKVLKILHKGSKQVI